MRLPKDEETILCCRGFCRRTWWRTWRIYKGKIAAGATAHFDAKKRILQLYGPKATDRYKQAMVLVMTDKPSQHCRKLINILCPKHPILVDFCAEPMISGMWREQLPALVRAVVANHELGDRKLQDTMDIADLFDLYFHGDWLSF